MVGFDVEEVLRADGGTILLGDLVGEATSGEAPSVAGLFEDLS
jgi:hypothetical protein